MIELKEKIQSAMTGFASGNLLDNAKSLLNVLGYESERTVQLSPNNYKGFAELFHAGPSNFDAEKARVKDWQTIDIIFQLTEDDIKKTHSLFEAKKVDNTIIESYLFFALSLTGDKCTRGDLVRITREINKLTPMPAMILFKYNNYLTVAVIDRRLHKRESTKDVLEKVTLIKDIQIPSPSPTGEGRGEVHRAHIEILFDLSLDALQRKTGFTNFVELHNAWRKTLDTKELNKSFYKKLFNWYLYAVKTVAFPNPDKIPYEVNNSINIIRLLTRLIFCWFIKEKGLIPDDLFDEEKVQEILVGAGFKPALGDQKTGRVTNPPLQKDQSAYYKAVLQNLFFATLNTEMNRDNPGSRRFISEQQVNGINPDYNNFTVYRHRRLFRDPDAALKLFEDIPFLNGGLFECLDTVETGEKKNREIRYDGFSTMASKQPVVPDALFFGQIADVDLSKDLGGGNTGKHETVIGLIDILNGYKFTITENTPLEEEVALDPELLGKVFENLLASYNPETRNTARNQTGSFYTPREIVSYMVDESIIAYLRTALDSNVGAGSKPAPTNEQAQTGRVTNPPLHNNDSRLRHLFAYDNLPHEFDSDEVDVLIDALSSARILDPACGSGAFPMGVLHRMVHLLGKLDPNNLKWKQAQLDIVEKDRQRALEMQDSSVREGALKSVEERRAYIEASFDSSQHELDYLRKLFLIENCIYGVDIQNIAVQIAKLRFFISLIVEQKKDETKPNLGILAMPNLETKFVAADSLIALERPAQLDLGSHPVEKAEFELRQVRERIFYARKYRDKKELRRQEKLKREALEKALIEGNWEKTTAHQIAAWNPFDVSGSAPFFDPEMMFGITTNSPFVGCGGFDIIIGNPPYIQIQSFSGQSVQKAWEAQKYTTYTKTGDVYCLFYERGVNLLAPQGVLTYISSNKWMRANYGKALRKFFLEKVRIGQLIDFGDSPIFESATTYTNILVLQNSASDQPIQTWDLSKAYAADTTLELMLEKQGVGESLFNEDSFVIASGGQAFIKKRIEEIGTPLNMLDIVIYRGILTGLNEAFIINGKKKDELIAQDPMSAEIIKPILRGRDIKRYQADFADLWIINSHNGYGNVPRIDVPKDYSAIWKHLQKINKETNEGVEKRQDQGVHWSNLRNCAYLPECEKEKIVYAEIVFDSAFYFDTKKYYPEATSFIMTGEHLKYLTALLNSTLLTYAFRTFYAGGDLRGDTFRYKKVFIENLPIPKIAANAQLPYEILVDCILFAHEKGLSSEASTLEWVVNVMVYGLYFEAEMKKAHCYINDRVAEVVKPFKPEDTDEFKTEYVKKLNEFFLKDKIIYHGLIHSRNVGPVEIIHVARKKLATND